MFEIWGRRSCRAFLFFCLISLGGCALVPNREARLKRQEEFEKKISNFNKLIEDMKSENLKKGIPSRAAREAYGEPDDTLSSGSSTSKFEIWCYNKILTKNDQTWSQIRLYFSDDKLISWSY